MENRLYKKILGCLSMVAIGDALGMPCHDMTIDEIRRRFNGPVETFFPPFDDTRVHSGLGAASVTDDTILTLALAKAYIRTDGRITPASVTTWALEGYQNAAAKGFGSMFGPSTRRALDVFAEGKDPVQSCLEEKHPMACTSNGAAMRISPVGLVHPENPEAAIQDAVTVCLPSHCTQTAIASACAIASGISEAMSMDADLFSVAQAVLAGARKGETIGMQKGRTVPVPSMEKRIQLAISIALKAPDLEAAARSLADIIGTGLAAYESIPSAVGIFVAAQGDPMRSVVGGANIGYDTDTIASIAGALSGALKGVDRIPEDLLIQVEEKNDLDLKHTARKLAKIALGNLEGRRAEDEN